MKEMKDLTIHQVDPALVRPFVHRDRDPEEFARSVEDTRRRGQVQPGKVRDISHLPPEERKRPKGGLYRYELLSGEGRLLRAKKLGQKFRAFIVEASETDAVGEFLSENLNRVALPWAQKARLVQPLLQAGIPAKEIAKRHALTPGHLQKFRRILDKTAAGLEDEVSGMAMNDAEAFTALPAGHQSIVLQVFKETKPGTIRELVRRARRVAKEDGGELSATALRKSIERLDEDLRRMRDRMKLARLHHALGPQNLALLLDDPKFRRVMETEGVPFAKFEKLSEA